MQPDLFGRRLDAVAIERLKTFEPPEGYHLAFSGGKDSQVIYRLAELAGVRFDAHMALTTVDPPELLAFVRANYPGVELHRPNESMWRLIRRNGIPPTRVIRYCCTALKESHGAGRTIIMGIRAAESVKRAHRPMFEQCNRGRKHTAFLCPIIDWTTEDVWEFHTEQGLPHCSLYDEGFTRIGCIGCPMSERKGQARDFARWPGYYRAYVKTFDRMLQERKTPFLQGGVSVTTGAEVMAWWIAHAEREPEGDASQCMLDLWS